MRVSLRWLSEYVDLPAVSEGELADRLTLAGLEVEGIQAFGPLEGVVVGRVVSVEAHPHADQLSVCEVDVGGQTLTVVCGAALSAGELVPLALPGARTPALEVKRRRIRGVKSLGMILSRAEVGLEAHSTEVWHLPDDITPGTDFSSLVEAPDTVFYLKITSNRPDLLGVYGVAREVGALYGLPLRPLDLSFPEEGPEAATLTQVSIEDPEDCPRYLARVILGVTPRPSPLWLQARLAKAGMRAITLLVDITNYVMLELGHPLHAFDQRKVQKIHVRRARTGEALRTLDGVERRLSPEVLLITDGRRPVAVAGVIGGKETEVTEDTQAVLLEAACFSPARVRRSARALGLRTEASLRFERALSPETADQSSRRFSALLARHGPGHIARGAVDVYPRPPGGKQLWLRKARLREILGMEIPEGEVGHGLLALGVELSEQGDRWEARVPSFRTDLKREIDLIEEVARLFGYDRIPATAPRVTPRVGKKDQKLTFADRIRQILMALGLSEAYNFGLIPREEAQVTLRNPMAAGQEGLRVTLCPQLLAAVRENLEAQAPGVALFEVGRVFRREGAKIVEEDRLGVVLCGRPPLPLGGKAEYSPNDLKGILDALLCALRVEGVTLGEVEDDRLHPYRRAGIYLGGKQESSKSQKGGSGELIGWLGELSPRFGLPGGRRALALELALAPLALAAQAPRYQPLPRFPASKRDLSLIVPRELAEGEVRTRILAQALVETCFLYDLYQGPGVPLGHRSLTYEITFRHPERTLEAWEVEEAMGQILRGLSPLGVRLRT